MGPGLGLGARARRWNWLLLAALAGGVMWIGWRWWEVRIARRAMAAIEEEIEQNRYGSASRRAPGVARSRAGLG